MSYPRFYDKRKLAIIALILANIIWGAAGPVFKWSLTNIPPFTLALLRFNLAAVLLFPFVHKIIGKIDRSDIPKIILFGLCGVTVNISFFFWGLKLAPSINAAIISTTQPLMLLVLGALFLKENVRRIEIFGTFISLAGVLFIILFPLFKNGFQTEIAALGNLFFVIAAFGALGQAYFGKKLFVKYSPLPLTFWSFVVGIVSFFPLFIVECLNNPNWLFDLKAPGLTGIVYGAVFSSALAYSFFDWGLSKIEASETGIFSYLMPVVAILTAVVFFQEKIGGEFFFGAVLIVCGIVIAQHISRFSPLHKKS